MWLPWVGRQREMNMQSTEDFQGSKNTPYATVMMEMSLYICPKQ